MDNNAQSGLPGSAFQVWMGQWRLTTLDTEGCMFVLRFLLRNFSARRPEDQFWTFLRNFLFSDDTHDNSDEDAVFAQSSRDLLAHATALKPDQARALVAYLGECYATETDRQFWATVSEAIQLYTVAPYTGRSGGTA